MSLHSRMPGSSLHNKLIGGAIAFWALLTACAFAFSNAFRLPEVLIWLFSLAIIPAGLAAYGFVFYFWSMKRHTRTTHHFLSKSVLRDYWFKPLWAFTCLALATGAIDLMLLANRFLDNSPAQQIVLLPVIEKISLGRKFGRRVIVESPVPGPYPLNFSRYESFELYSSAYRRAVPGKSRLEIPLHKGFLGIPWYGNVELLPASASGQW